MSVDLSSFTTQTAPALSSYLVGYTTAVSGGQMKITLTNLIALIAANISLPVGQLSGTANLTESTSSVLTIVGGAGALLGACSIQVKQASSSQSGYLSSTDWTTFNNKVASSVTTLSSLSSANGSTIPAGKTLMANDFSNSSSGALPNGSTATTQTPSDNSTKLATTAYVDLAVLGQDFKEACKYATTAALPTLIYNNGSSGVGATLTAVSFGALSIDGSTPSIGDRILIKNQVSTFQNGIYVVTTVGTVAAVFVLTRAVDFNQSSEIKTGDSTFVTTGSANSATTWANTSIDSPTIGTDAITFAQTAGQGSFSAGNGIAITGNSIAIDTSITVDKTTAQTLTNKTLTTPVLSGLPTGSGVASAATASTIVSRDSNANITANNIIGGFASTATAAGTTTLTISSAPIQLFTGSTTQTVKLPATTNGVGFTIINSSTGVLTIQSSGSNTIGTIGAGAAATFTCINTSGTTAASWQLMPYGGLTDPTTTIGDLIQRGSSAPVRVPFAQAAASIGIIGGVVRILDSNGLPMSPAQSDKFVRIQDECTNDCSQSGGGPLTGKSSAANSGSVGFNVYGQLFDNAVAPADYIGMQCLKLSGGNNGSQASLSSAPFSTFYNNFNNGGKIWLLKCRLQLSVTSSVTNQYNLRLGVGADLSAENDGIYILYDYANSANINFITRNSGSETSTGTSFAPTAYTFFDLAIGDDGTNSYCYINGTLVATNSTNRISSSTHIKNFCANLFAKSTTFGDLGCGIDFVSFETYISSRS